MPLLDELFGIPPGVVDIPGIAPQQRRAGAPMPMAPLPPPETEPTAPSARVQRPNFDDGYSQAGVVLEGLFGNGVIGGLGKAMQANASREAQVARKNETYDWLIKKGVDADTARLVVTNPDVAKAMLPRLLGGAQTGEAATKGAPDGYSWNDPMDATKGVSRIPGFVPKPDPIEQAYQRSRFQADNQRMKEINEAGDAGRAQESNINQLRAAREGVSYEGGPWQGIRTTLGKWLPDGVGPFGLPFIPSREEAGKAEQVGSLATEVQLGFVSKTKGAISNREMDIFGSATPGMTMSDAGAKQVLDGMEAGAARASERAKFFEAWRAKNRSLDGAQEAWDQFIDANPVFEKDDKGGFTINRNNIGAWRGYLDGGSPAPGSTTDGPQTPAAETPLSSSGVSPLANSGSANPALDRARAAIAQGADRNAVIKRLQAAGIDATGL
jgi:hypothetical protein